jgi:uncharacterized membrane protein
VTPSPSLLEGPSAFGTTTYTEPPNVTQRARSLLFGVLGLLFLVTVAGLAYLWPTGHIQHVTGTASSGAPVFQESGSVQTINKGFCPSTDDTAGQIYTATTVNAAASVQSHSGPTSKACQKAIVAIESGPDRSSFTVLEIQDGPLSPNLHPGQSIRLGRALTGADTQAAGSSQYYFTDYARGLPLTLLGIVFAAVVILVGRSRGLSALIGLILAGVLIAKFVLPALLQGKPALEVALVGSAAILFVVLYVAHGFTVRTSTALLGTLVSLGLVGVLAAVAESFTHLSGLSGGDQPNLSDLASRVSIGGLTLAGFVISSLGVLNDVTVTQASAAYEITAADPSATWRLRYQSAMRVGRDHIASTVYTLALAYTGSALPVLLLFTISGFSINDIATNDAVASELVGALVGGIGLTAAVPLTTALACTLSGDWARREKARRDGPPVDPTAPNRLHIPLIHGELGETPRQHVVTLPRVQPIEQPYPPRQGPPQPVWVEQPRPDEYPERPVEYTERPAAYQERPAAHSEQPEPERVPEIHQQLPPNPLAHRRQHPLLAGPVLTADTPRREIRLPDTPSSNGSHPAGEDEQPSGPVDGT